MRIRKSFAMKNLWLVCPIGIFLLLRYEVVAFLEPLAFLARTTAQQTSEDSRLSFKPFRHTSLAATSSDDGRDGDKTSSELDETRNIVKDQQEKIDMLMKLLVSKEDTTLSLSSVNQPKNLGTDDSSSQFSAQTQQPVESSYGIQSILPPLKAMMFIDGTWLYYSLHGREDDLCPIQSRYGKGWQFRYNVDWGNLPGVICQALQEQDEERGWSAQSMGPNGQHISRPIEITRVSVFTSYKADTPTTSLRYQMFQEMLNAKYDVHMMETVGKGEKCVDIQLAVDMMHYATVPDAYDVALLLTGDKDFMPAMARCRQKGRRIGLVSMRRACNRALYETPNLKDFDVIWLEDHLDEFIQEKRYGEKRIQNPNVSEFALITIVKDFIAESGLTRVSSRDIGKYIKTLYIGERCLLDEVKQTYGGLYQFLVVSEVFVADKKVSEKQFWVAARENMDMKLEKLTKVTKFTYDEKEFFEDYDPTFLADERDMYYRHSYEGDDWPSREDFISSPRNRSPVVSTNLGQPMAPTPEFANMKVVELKEICREKGLLVSGKKADLIQRLVDDYEKNQEDSSTQSTEDLSPEAYVEGLISEYLQVKGGSASSRDVGRYLQANKASAERLAHERGGHTSALQELKELYGSVRRYIYSSGVFKEVEIKDPHHDTREFLVQFANSKQ